MILAQTPFDWAEVLNHSVAIGVVLFFGMGLIWLTKRLFGSDGIITRSAERSAATMEKYGDSLVALTDLNRSQQTLCSAHAGSMKVLEQFSERMIELHTDPESTFSTVGLREKLEGIDANAKKAVANSMVMAETWAKRNHREYRTPPVLDAMIHIIETAEELAPRCNCDCQTELRSLRQKIEGVKAKMKET